MRKKITLKEISKRFNVSISTVSKALKDSPEISERTRKLIQEFAKEHNYKPNNIALSLKNQKTKNLGIVLPEIQHFFFSSITTGIEKCATKRGYNVIICISNETFEKEVINMEMLANGSIDGFIMALSQGTQKAGDFHHIKEVINRGMPVVMIDRVTEEVDCDKVIIDDFKGAYDAVNYLIDQGKKKIAILTMPDYMGSVGKLRTEGYKKALRDAGIEIDEKRIVKLDNFYNDFEAVEALFKESEVDAVFAVTEFFAVQAIKMAQKSGLKTPDDIAVIGFTDGIISKSSSPSLTTVSQHGEEIGYRAASLLIDRLENESDEEPPYTKEIIQTTIVKRESA
ncbi:LacI family transcriptional regulator [Robertkochia marina]|uniref:LacI family transcriptional regulator n=1 Tax=Robertkochia marina TaxID=1227945 RepID=A0A4S3M4K2_9FLAO|nr:LacI family DNA-binding transcriptional regulator [Robertkochia marina]THD69755.1 LacI family transcriptional regulator [Robertkochia marina]TRZ46902.1 LacI family transcriptional regulator [Robertkochia marina]